MIGNSSNSVKLMLFKSGNHMSRDLAKTLVQTLEGGDPTQQLLNKLSDDSSDLRGLIDNIKDKKKWISGKLPDGTPAIFNRNGSAMCAIATTEMDAETRDKLNLKDAQYTRIANVYFGSPSFTTTQEIGLVVFDAAAATAITKAVNPFISKIIGRLQAGLEALVTRIFAAEVAQGEVVIGEEIEVVVQGEIEQTIEIEEIAETFVIEIDTSIVEGSLILIGRGLLSLIGWVALALIVYFAVKWITDILFRKYNSVLFVVNVTDQNLLPTLQYLDNIPSQKVGDSSKQTLWAISSVEQSPFKDFNPDDPVVSTAMYSFYNHNKILEGLGYLIEFKNVTKDTTSSLQNMMATVDIPRISDNSISVWFNENSTDYKALYKAKEGCNKKLQVEASLGDYTATLTINALSGAKDNQYMSVLTIADKENFQDFKDYADQ